MTNMKCGVVAIKELADFLKERARLEEENSKAHAKISKQVNYQILTNWMQGCFVALPKSGKGRWIPNILLFKLGERH